MENVEPNLPTPEEIEIVPALPYNYSADDERINRILDDVAEFCGKEFTVVPPNPDGEKDPETGEIEGGVPVPHANEGTDVPPVETEGEADPDYGGNEHDNSGAEKYPEGTGEETDPDLDELRAAYKEAKEKNEAEKASYWALLWQVIRLLSDATCWTDSYDDTFIYQYRSQTHEIDQKPRCCPVQGRCANWTKIKLHYAPVEITCDPDDDRAPQEREHIAKPFIGGEFHYMDETGDYKIVKIDQKYLNKHYNLHTQEVTIMGADFPDVLTYGKCDCPQTVTLVLHYNAGYCNIPKALLPLVCQLIHKIEDSTKSINECAGAMTQVAGLLKSKKIGNVQYSWSDKDTEASKTQALFTELYNIANVAELFSISRCDIINTEIAGEVI